MFGIDPRSLALFRVAIGALLLADLAVRVTDLGAMYTDGGMFPRSEIGYHFTTIWNWSFHFAGGSWEFQACLFSIAFVLALALAVGLQTRLAAVGSWLFLVSLHHRASPILSGADILLRVLLFWGMFLPLGRVWSVDEWLGRRRGIKAAQGPVLSVASAALLLQMGFMYLFSAISKSNAEWLRGGVIANSLGHAFYAKPLGAWFLRFPHLLTGLTWGAFVLEWVAPVLMFFPKRTPWLRVGAVAALAAMHIGIALSLEVDLFSPVALAGLSLFLPAEFWDCSLFARFLPAITPTQPPSPGLALLGRSWLLRIREGVCLVLLLYVLGVNINGLPGHPLTSQPPAKQGPFWTALGLGQKWNMFDEAPSRNGWYVARATLNDGSEVDLLRHGAKVEWSKPEFPAALYPNFRWRKIFREMSYADELGYQVFRMPVARYLCRDWNARHPGPTQIAKFDLEFCSLQRAGSGEIPNLQFTVRENLAHLALASEDSRPFLSDVSPAAYSALGVGAR